MVQGDTAEGAPDKLMQETPGESGGGVPRSTELREEELGGGWTGLITKLANVCVYQASFRVWMEGALG